MPSPPAIETSRNTTSGWCVAACLIAVAMLVAVHPTDIRGFRLIAASSRWMEAGSESTIIADNDASAGLQGGLIIVNSDDQERWNVSRRYLPDAKSPKYMPPQQDLWAISGSGRVFPIG